MGYHRFSELSPAVELRSGPTIREFVFKGAKVRLGDGNVGKFALTLWRFEPGGPVPDVVEISFKCRITDGHMSGASARRALNLFNGLQEDLGDWLNQRNSSKTALALPSSCSAQHAET